MGVFRGHVANGPRPWGDVRRRRPNPFEGEVAYKRLLLVVWEQDNVFVGPPRECRRNGARRPAEREPSDAVTEQRNALSEAPVEAQMTLDVAVAVLVAVGDRKTSKSTETARNDEAANAPKTKK